MPPPLTLPVPLPSTVAARTEPAPSSRSVGFPSSISPSRVGAWPAARPRQPPSATAAESVAAGATGGATASAAGSDPSVASLRGGRRLGRVGSQRGTGARDKPDAAPEEPQADTPSSGAAPADAAAPGEPEPRAEKKQRDANAPGERGLRAPVTRPCRLCRVLYSRERNTIRLLKGSRCP